MTAMPLWFVQKLYFLTIEFWAKDISKNLNCDGKFYSEIGHGTKNQLHQADWPWTTSTLSGVKYSNRSASSLWLLCICINQEMHSIILGPRALIQYKDVFLPI